MIFELDVERVRHRPGIKWGRHGADVLAAWVADMDVEVPSFITDAVKGRIDAGALGYDFYDEPIPVYQCFVDRMRDRFGWETSVDELIRMQDVVQGLQLAICQLTAPGDGVIVQSPIYPPFLSSITGNDRVVIDNPMVPTESSWELDLEHLAEVMAVPSTTMLLLCNPHNPLGRVLRADELEAVAALATEHGVTVVSDEIHLDLVYAPNQHIPFASVSPEAAECAVTLTAATKSFNIAALRLSYLHTHSARLRAKIDEIPARLLGGCNSLGQIATVVGWGEGQAWLDELIVGLDHNRRLLAELLGEHLPGVVYRQPEATYLAWLDCRGLGLDRPPHEVFLDGGVALNAGPDFGLGGDGHVRLNFATSPEILEMVVRRMADAVS